MNSNDNSFAVNMFQWLQDKGFSWFEVVKDDGTKNGINILIPLETFDSSVTDDIEDILSTSDDGAGITTFQPDPGRKDENQLIWVGRKNRGTLDSMKDAFGM
jgi:hypothetical protein